MKTIEPHLLFCFVVMIALCGCEPKRPYQCEQSYGSAARVLEHGTNIPVEGVKVYLYHYRETNDDFPRLAFVTETNAEGIARWDCELRVTDVCVQKEGYYGQDCGTSGFYYSAYQYNGVYYVYPLAWIEIRAMDLEPQNPDHYVRIDLLNEDVDLGHAESVIEETAGDGFFDVHWSVRSHSTGDVIDSGSEMEYCLTGDTLKTKINY